MAVGWLVLWGLGVVWCAAVTRTSAGHLMGARLGIAGAALGAIALVLLSLCGYLLGRNQRWEYVWALIGYVGVQILALYVVAMLMVPTSTGSDNDTAAGAGLVIIGAPMLCIVGLFVAIGAGASLLAERLSPRREGGDEEGT
jgi:hypothetical protein